MISLNTLLHNCLFRYHILNCFHCIDNAVSGHFMRKTLWAKFNTIGYRSSYYQTYYIYRYIYISIEFVYDLTLPLSLYLAVSPQLLALRHRKDAESGASIRQYSLQLGSDTSSMFAQNIAQFIKVGGVCRARLVL